MAIPYLHVSNTTVDSPGIKTDTESDEDNNLDLFDPALEEKLKFEAVEVRVFGNHVKNTEQKGLESVVVKPLLREESPVKICVSDIPDIAGDILPDYEELEDDFDIRWTSKKEPSPETFDHEFDVLYHRGVRQLSDDRGVETLSDRSSVSENGDSDPLKSARSKTNTCRLVYKFARTTNESGNSVYTYAHKSQSGEEKEEDDRKMDLDPNEVDDYNSKITVDGLMKKTRPHPYLGKGKKGLTGTSKIKTSDKQNNTPFVSGQRPNTNIAPAAEPSAPRLPEPVSPIECEGCHMIHSHNSVVQCCDGHLLCTSCVEKEAKKVIVGTRKGSVKCAVATCESSVPQSELRKSLPSIVLDLLEESWKKETLEALENMKDGVKCPGCGYSGVLDDSIKNFTCHRCQKTYCRLCEMEWHLKNHDLCIKLIKKVSEATGHTIHIPAHWTLDTNTETKLGFSVVALDPLSAEYLNIKGHFMQTQHCAMYKIKNVYRVQNQRLWEKYSLFRTHMMQDIGEAHIDESRLFHGTQTEVIDSICKEGFDWRLCGKHGTVYGHGTYFAKEARYSTRYSSRHGSRWKPGESSDSAKATGRGFPPSYTQSLRFNVLTGQPPGQPPSQPCTSSGTAAGLSGPPGTSLSIKKTFESLINTSSGSGNQLDWGKFGSGLSANHHTAGNSAGSTDTSKCVFGASPRYGLTGITLFGASGTSTDSTSAAANTTRPSVFTFGHMCTTPVTSAQSSLTSNPVGSGLFGQPPVGSGLFPQQSVILNPLPKRYHPSFTCVGGADSENFSYLFVARVLVGRKCLGRPDMKRPGKDAEGSPCHTAVDMIDNSKIFVVFESGQCYPEYLIEYSRKRKSLFI